jgi:hypothetical protein
MDSGFPERRFGDSLWFEGRTAMGKPLPMASSAMLSKISATSSSQSGAETSSKQLDMRLIKCDRL